MSILMMISYMRECLPGGEGFAGMSQTNEGEPIKLLWRFRHRGNIISYEHLISMDQLHSERFNHQEFTNALTKAKQNIEEATA